MLLILLISMIWKYVTISNFYLLQSTACARFTFLKNGYGTDAKEASVNTFFPQDSITLQGMHALNSSILDNPTIPIYTLNTDVTEDFCKSNSSKSCSHRSMVPKICG